MITDAEILSLLQLRQADLGARIATMRLVRMMVEGKMKVPLPEIDANEQTAVANLAQQASDAISQRIASTLPSPVFPTYKEGIQKSVDAARDRRNVMSSWWDENRMDLKLSKRARHFTVYAGSYVDIRPGKDCPQWVVRDPLSAYPSATEQDDPCIDDCIFSFQRPWAWLTRNYPAGVADIARSMRTKNADLFNLVEYCDDQEWVLLCTGRAVPDVTDRVGSTMVVRLERIENRTGMCPVASAGRISLDNSMGQFDGMVGMFMQQAKLMALELIAVQRGVFADTWLEPNAPGVQPKIVVQADGIRGLTGIVRDGTVRQMNENPGYKTDTTMDRLERNIRLQGKIPAEYGGESGSNIRTGVRGDAVLAAVVDFPVQEAQRAFARSMQHEDRVAIAIDRAWYGNASKTVWMGNRRTTYVPNQLWDDGMGGCADHHVVSYSFAGVDANNLRLSSLQSVGAGAMSVRRSMELDPLIDDVDMEMGRMSGEALDKAGMAALQQQAAGGQIPPSDIARIKQLIGAGRSWEDAVTLAHNEAQARQATQAPQGAPEAQPGIAQPGAGAEQPTIGAPPEGGANLAALLGQLKQGQRQMVNTQ